MATRFPCCAHRGVLTAMDQMDQMDEMKPINPQHLVPNVLLALVVVLVPVFGHIILTAIILRDDLAVWQKVAWILVSWIVWWVGPFLYLLLGQRRNRLLNFM
jgi:hypothetical protein